MKKIFIIVTLLIAFKPAGSFGSNQTIEEIVVTNTKPLNLGQMKLGTQVRFVSDYPGTSAESICSVELKDNFGFTSALVHFLKQVNVYQLFGSKPKTDLVVTNGSITIDISLGHSLYVGGIYISSKSRKTIDQLIFENFLTHFNNLILIPHLCGENN